MLFEDFITWQHPVSCRRWNDVGKHVDWWPQRVVKFKEQTDAEFCKACLSL